MTDFSDSLFKQTSFPFCFSFFFSRSFENVKETMTESPRRPTLLANLEPPTTRGLFFLFVFHV